MLKYGCIRMAVAQGSVVAEVIVDYLMAFTEIGRACVPPKGVVRCSPRIGNSGHRYVKGLGAGGGDLITSFVQGIISKFAFLCRYLPGECRVFRVPFILYDHVEVKKKTPNKVTGTV